ncbi:MAG: hypothetical protein M2R45_03475 [Verrucomicrobia subdivision 3 bacterium]|nr:hypothetical protein [Limisphaerales bacterium]MCS1416674.1 hypothetical protein [Limisphaerales bacterium]
MGLRIGEVKSIRVGYRLAGGCLVLGCLISVILFALGRGGAYFGVEQAIKSVICKCMETVLCMMSMVEISVEESFALRERVDNFRAGLEKAENTDCLD